MRIVYNCGIIYVILRNQNATVRKSAVFIIVLRRGERARDREEVLVEFELELSV